MKNVATKLLILFLGSAFALQAQDENSFRFGIHGEPAISYISTDHPGYESSAPLKFGFGLIAEYYFAEHYAFSSGVTVIQRGGELEGVPLTINGNTVAGRGNFNGSYLQLPVRLKMTTREFGYFTGFAEFGGALALNIDEKVSFEPQLAENEMDDDYVNFFNALFTIGLGGEYNLGGSTSLTAGLYYNRSLIDNLEDDLDVMGDLTSGSYEYRFDYVSLRVGILF